MLPRLLLITVNGLEDYQCTDGLGLECNWKEPDVNYWLTAVTVTVSTTGIKN